MPYHRFSSVKTQQAHTTLYNSSWLDHFNTIGIAAAASLRTCRHPVAVNNLAYSP